MIQAGPRWVGGNREGHFELGGKRIEWRDAMEVDGAGLAKRLTGRSVVATRLDDNIAFLRLDDGTHLAFEGFGGQGVDGLICLLWEDDPPE